MHEHITKVDAAQLSELNLLNHCSCICFKELVPTIAETSVEVKVFR